MKRGNLAPHLRRARLAYLGACFMTGLCSIAGTVRGETIVGWHFNERDPGAVEIKADMGVGDLDMSSFAGEWEPFQGTSLNAMDGWIAGDALGVRGWKWNDSSMLLGFESHFRDELSLSMAARRSSTGFTTLRIESLVSTGWVELGTETIARDWRVVEVAIPVEFLQEDAPLLRLTVLGATTSQGTMRIDNLRIDGVVVPGPGGACALVPAARMHRRRSRRRCRTTTAG